MLLFMSPDRSGNPCGSGFDPQDWNGEQEPLFLKMPNFSAPKKTIRYKKAEFVMNSAFV